MTSHDDLVKHIIRLLTYYRGRIGWITSRVFILTVAITALGLAFSPKYVARTKLTLLPTRSEIGYAAMRPDMAGVSPAAMLGQTHVEGLLSRTLAEDVARTLQAENTPELNNGGVAGHIRRQVIAPVADSIHRVITLLNTGRWETPDPFMSLVYGIQGSTGVQNVPGSFVYQVSVTWNNPKLAAKIANLLTERYVKMTLQAGQEEMRMTREFIESRIKETRTGLDALEIKIKDYRTAEKLYSSSTDMDMGLQELSQYLRDLNATRVNWEQLDGRINALKSYQTPAALAAVEAERTGLKSRQTAVEKVITEQIAKLDKLPAKEAGLLDLYRERLIGERALGALQDRLLDTRMAEASQLSTVRVIDTALPPVYPERPLLLHNAAASLLVGLLLSAGFVLLAEGRRAGLRSREDLGSEGDALIGLVPYGSAAGQDDPDSEKAGKMSEFFRGVAHGRCGTVAHRRTFKRHLEHLLVRLADRGGARVCLLVSLNGGEGKTFLAGQLAKLAGEAGRKVLLIDANLGEPALNRAFDKPPAAGLADVLAGKTSAGEVVVHINESIDLIGAGLTRLHPQAKWAIDSTRTEIGALATRYDLVLIDSASLRCDSSVNRLLPLATDLLCVFDATTSTRSDLDDVRERVRGASAGLTFVLNKVLHPADYLFEMGSDGHKPKHANPVESAQDPAADASLEHAVDL